jgi:transcriptional regulator with XRE-family HTH domain
MSTRKLNHPRQRVRVTPEMRAECIRLRQVERRSSPEIKMILGISTTTICEILKGMPLTREEMRARKAKTAAAMRVALVKRGHYQGGAEWTIQETNRLQRMWYFASRAEIVAAFPGRTWAAISRQGAMCGFRRSRYAASGAKNRADAIFQQLRQIREMRRVTVEEVADVTGYHKVYITRVELGVCRPSWFFVRAWLDALGCDIKVIEKERMGREQERRKNKFIGPEIIGALADQRERR